MVSISYKNIDNYLTDSGFKNKVTQETVPMPSYLMGKTDLVMLL